MIQPTAAELTGREHHGAGDLSAPSLRISNLGKEYTPGQWVLRGFELDLSPGEIHGLVGVNGAGKSTVIKILSGVVPQTEGTIHLGSTTLESFSGPKDAAAAGIGVVHQELPLLPNLTAVENVVLGLENKGLLASGDRREAVSLYRRIASSFPSAPAPAARLSECTLFEWQVVAIIRALAAQSKFVIFDEPTSSLSSGERDAFHRVVRRVADEGRGVLYVSHYLDDMLEVPDNVTVIRDGRVAACRAARDLTEAELLAAMLGGQVMQNGQRTERSAMESSGSVVDPSRTVLDVVRLSGAGYGPVDLRVERGECVGLYGLHGSGAESLLAGLFGVAPSRGDVSLNGRPISGGPARRTRRGMAFVSGDRKRTLMADWSVAMNHALPSLPSRPLFAHLDFRRVYRETRETIDAYSVVAGPDQAMRTLSGGNQQKVALGRWLPRQPSLLLLQEPTLGVDVAGRGRIHMGIREVAAGGAGVLIHSTDPEEIVATCDRALVLVNGHVLRELRGGSLDVETLEEATRSASRHSGLSTTP